MSLGARLADGVSARARVHDHVGRTDRLAHARRTMGRPHNFPRFTRTTTGRPARGGSRRRSSTCERGAASSYTRITRCRGASLRPTSTSTSTNLPNYHGNAAFHGGIVQIQNHLPMWTNFKARFALDGPHVHSIASISTPTGPRPSRAGDVEFAQAGRSRAINVKSRVQFPRMREHLLQGREVEADRATAISPARSGCSRAATT